MWRRSRGGPAIQADWRLRDIRRFLARSTPLYEEEEDIRVTCEVIHRALGVEVDLQDYTQQDRLLDRAISLYGPDARFPAAPESRPKNTDEVNGSTQTGDQTHGGDSQSGEVPEGQSGAGQKLRPELDSLQAQRGTSGHAASSEQSDSCATAQAGPESEHESQGDEVTERSGALDILPETEESDTPGLMAQETAGDFDTTGENERLDAESHGDAVSPVAPKQSRSGNYLDQEKMKEIMPERRLADILKRLVSTFQRIGGIEESPRVDSRRLVRELIIRRYHLTRAVRRELARNHILIMVDTSGSCAGVCNATYATACSLAGQVDGVLVLVHVNGYPEYFWNGNRWLDVYRGTLIPKLEFYENLLLQYPIPAVIAFGDWDAGDVYEYLADNHIKLIWLDDYAAVSGAKPVPPNGTLAQGLKSWKVKPFVHWQGVNSSASAAIALKAALRKGSK